MTVLSRREKFRRTCVPVRTSRGQEVFLAKLSILNALSFSTYEKSNVLGWTNDPIIYPPLKLTIIVRES